MPIPRTSDPGRIVAHRGASKLAPENTLTAFRKAAEQGARWIEFDVSLLGDGTAVVHHDATLDRCSTHTGALADLRAADLAGIDMGQKFSKLYAGEPLPRLDQTLELIQALGLFANLEIKPHDQDPDQIANAVAMALEAQEDLAARILVSSFSKEALAALRQIRPAQPIAMLYERPPEDWAETTGALAATALHIHYRHLDDVILRAARRAAIDLRVYTINQPGLMRPFRELGLTGVITDHPPLFLDDPEWKAWSEV